MSQLKRVLGPKVDSICFVLSATSKHLRQDWKNMIGPIMHEQTSSALRAIIVASLKYFYVDTPGPRDIASTASSRLTSGAAKHDMLVQTYDVESPGDPHVRETTAMFHRRLQRKRGGARPGRLAITRTT